VSDGQWDWLIDLVAGPVRDLVLGEVSKWVRQPIERLMAPIRTIADRVSGVVDAARGIPGQLLAGLAAPLATIGHRIASAPGQLVGPLASPLVTIGHRIGSAPGQLVGPLASPLVTIGHRIGSAPGQLVGPLASPLVTIGHRIASNPGQIVGPLASPLINIRQALLHLSSAGIGAFLGPLLNVGAQIGLGTVGIKTLPANLGTVGMSLLLADQADRQRLSDQYWDKLTELRHTLQDGIGRAATQGVPGFLRGLETNVTSTLAIGYDLVSGYILGQGQISPNDAPTVGMRAFLAASGLGAAAHAVSTAVELVHPLKTMGVHYLSGFLADMGSFSSISNALMGTLANVGIAQPMRYYLNARTRPTIPTPGDLQAMHRKHTLSPARFAQNMGYWGYSQEWIDDYIEYLPADPRLFDILRMAETGIPEASPPASAIATLQKMGIRSSGNPNWWLEMKFALAGYNWIDIPKLVQTVRLRMTSTERNRLITTSSTNFRDGYMTEADYRLNLADAGKTQASIEWRVRAERLASLNDDIDDLVKLFVDQFLKDVLTYDELVIGMINVGVTPTKTAILARRAAIRKQPKPVDDTKKIQEKATREMQTTFSRMYKERYRADMVTAAEYYADLRAIGIRDDVAWATVEIEIARRIGQTTKTRLKAEAQAVTRTQAAQQRLYRERYRAGQIDAGTYYNQLVIAGVLPPEARAIVDAEVTRTQAAQADAAASLARAEVTRTQAALERLYRDQFRAYMVDHVQYQANLVTIGLSPARATAVVQDELTNRQASLSATEAREAAATQRAAQRAESNLLRAKYDAGLLDADQYLAGLLQIGTDPDLAWAIVELAEVNRWSLLQRQALKDQEKADLAVQRAQGQLYTRRYRAGELTERQLYDNLVAIGVPELLVATSVELEADQRQADADAVREQLVIPAIKRAWTLFVKDAEARYKSGELTLDQYVAQLIFSGVADDIAQIIALSTQRIRGT
jgi:hypothetical protein